MKYIEITLKGHHMIDLKTIECRYCGNHIESLFKQKDSSLVCKCCGSWYQCEDSEEQRECSIGMSQLRRYKFDEARDTFEYVVTRYPNSVGALWGLLLARFGVVFVKGFYKNVTEPIYCFHNYDKMRKRYIQNEPEYEKIMALLKDDDELRFDYEKKARQIDDALDNFKKYKKSTERDVFICVKISAATHEHPERTGRTEDYQLALKLYEDLKKRGVNVFFSFVTLKNDVDSDEKIWRNLVQSKKMLLIGSCEEYLESPWVKSEWKRWLYLGREDELYIFVMNNDEYETPFDILPNELSDNQIYTQETYNKLISDICGDIVKGGTESFVGAESAKEDIPFHSEQLQTAIAREEALRIRLQAEENRRAELEKIEAMQARQAEIISQAAEAEKQLESTSEADAKQIEQDYKTGNDYYYGANGKPKDYKKAIHFYAKAAVNGKAEAQFMLGYCYENALGTDKQYGQAAEWYAKAAAQDHLNAQNTLGTLYEQGYGVEKNYAKAVELYTKAAVQGNAAAQRNLGECYYYGRGIAKDYSKAFMWYKKAAEKGQMSAQYSLGYCYENGYGTEKNLDKAVEFYQKAAKQGSDNAQKALTRLNKPLLDSQPAMPPKANFFKRNFFGMVAILAVALLMFFAEGGIFGKAIYAITPLGLGEATGIENFGFSMMTLTICTAVVYVLLWIMIKFIAHEKDDFGFSTQILNFISCIGVWYAGYGISHLLVKISWGFHFFTVLLAIIISAIFCVAVFFITIFLEVFIYDEKDIAKKYFKEICGIVNVKFIVSLVLFHIGAALIGSSDSIIPLLVFCIGAIFSIFYAIKRIVVFCGKYGSRELRKGRIITETVLLIVSIIALIAIFVLTGTLSSGNELLDMLIMPCFITLPFVIIFRLIAILSMNVKKS